MLTFHSEQILMKLCAFLFTNSEITSHKLTTSQLVRLGNVMTWKSIVNETFLPDFIFAIYSLTTSQLLKSTFTVWAEYFSLIAYWHQEPLWTNQPLVSALHQRKRSTRQGGFYCLRLFKTLFFDVMHFLSRGPTWKVISSNESQKSSCSNK